MVAFPQSNLPPKSQPWARGLEKTVTTNASNARSTAVSTNNNLKQINSSINLLQRQQDTLVQNQESLAIQQAYLNTFQTYLSENNTTQSTSLVAQWVTLSTISVTFTLTRDATVLIEAMAETSSSSTRDNGSTGGVDWKCTLANSGATYESQIGSRFTINTPGAYAVNTYLYEPSTNSKVLSLTAGTHTFTVTWSVYNYGNGGGCTTKKKIITATVVG
jgi:hypothetical protein